MEIQLEFRIKNTRKAQTNIWKMQMPVDSVRSSMISIK